MISEAGVVVIHCSDPRFQPHFQDFLRRDLNLPNYFLVAVPGGPQFLTLASFLPKFSWAGWRWVKFAMNLGNPERVILIAHEECRWYRQVRFGTSPPDLREVQVKDLQQVRCEFAERFAKAKVELYYARFVRERVAFDLV